jgi:TnpA family transposase
MVDDDSVGSPADGLPTAQLELPLDSGHINMDETRSLKPLRREWTPELLGRHFLLSEKDMEEVSRCRSAENRLGFALNLLLIRFLNSVPVSLEHAPDTVVDFVGSQVTVESAVLVAYGKRRPQTRDDHAKRIRRYLGVRAFVASDGEPLLQFLVGRAMHRDDPAVLVGESEEWLRRERILLPVERTLDRLVTHARVVAEQKIHRTITSQLTPEHEGAFEELLEQPGSEAKVLPSASPSGRSSSFAWLKEPPRSAGEKSIKELARKLGMVQETRIENIDLSDLNRNRVKRLARLGLSYHSPALRRFDKEKRWAIMAATLAELRERITDDMVEMLNILIRRIFSQAATDLAEFQAQNAKTINQNLHVLRRATAVILDEAIPDSEVRRAVFEAEPKENLEQAYEQSGQSMRPEDYNNFDFIEKQYARLRKFLPVAIRTLPFTGTLAAKPVLEGIEFLRELDASKIRKLPADVPMGFVDDGWRRAMVVETPSVNGRGKDPSINRRLWELCLADRIQDALRSSDLHVVGSREHRDWTSYLHTEEAWEARRESWFVDWHASTDPDEYLEQAADTLDRKLREVAATLKDNPFASVVDGELRLSEDDKVEIPNSAKDLRKKVVALLPRVSLADLLIEVDSWVEVRDHFTHAGQINGHPPGTSPRNGSPSRQGSLLDTCIFAVLVARGCNLPLNRMANASGIPYHNLVHTADWYFGEECIREAIVALVNYHHSLPISSAFGPGTTAMSDGIRFGVSARSLYARPNPRYFGTTGRGVTVYDTTSDQYTSPYVQVIRCNLREAVAVLDGILHHETELPLQESVVDTHGYTESLFGLFELEDKVFSPRIADLPDQRIYPMEKKRRGRPPKGGREPRYGELDALLRGPTINRKLIRECWDDMHKVAASLKDGTTSATLLVSKLNNLKRKSSVQQAIQELGRLHKTLFYLDYISNESLRLRIRSALNKGELLHSLARDLFFGQQGLFRERDYEAQLNRATCLSLLINAIAVWNARYEMAALQYLKENGNEFDEEDVSYLSPLLSEHINIHGTYHFDLADPNKREGLRPLRTSR